MKNVIKIAAAGALALSASATAAYANATAQPGETAGLAMGAPLPEGVYFVNTLDWGVTDTDNGDARVGVDIPVIAWSTPWHPLGANFQLLGALPMIHSDGPGGALDDAGLYNPFLAAKVAFDLGNGFGVSYLSGVYFNAGDKNIRVHATTWRQDFAISYTADGWNLTANLIWGIKDNDVRDGFNLDLTATKTFGKWEIGAIGFGSTQYDVSRSDRRLNGGKVEGFAVGPLVGYNFGPVIAQAALTTSIYTKNSDDDTRGWFRLIVPLWTPEAPMTPLVTKY
jgi:hypothetical protein